MNNLDNINTSDNKTNGDTIPPNIDIPDKNKINDDLVTPNIDIPDKKEINDDLVIPDIKKKSVDLTAAECKKARENGIKILLEHPEIFNPYF